MKRALDAKKIVVILFWNRHGVDDRSVKASLDRLSRRKRQGRDVHGPRRATSRATRASPRPRTSRHTPSLVIVNRKGQAEVVDGYLDRQTIGQYVQNACGASSTLAPARCG